MSLKSLTTFSNTATSIPNGFIVLDDYIIHDITTGTESKFWINFEGERFLVKDSSFNKKRKQPSLAPYCEHVGSTFIRLSGILECQHTSIGKFEGRDVVICSDIFKDKIFRPFKELHQSSAGTELDDKEYTYDDVLYVLQQKSLLSDSDIADFWSKFRFMFLFDAILGNRDRHEGNWGFVKGEKTYLAPIFDNGSSLFPDVNLDNWKTKEFLKDRVIKMPGSQFRMWKDNIFDRPMRTNFYEIIQNYSNKFHKELEVIRKLNYKKLITDSIIGVPKVYQEWFKAIIECRFRTLILKEDVDLVITQVLEGL